MKAPSRWIATAFCVFLCIFALVAWARSNSPSLWEPIFFSFLPICFVFVAINLSTMQREIDQLRQQISGLRERAASTTAG
jgi:TRAP-type C4-dicarboxylate transport system permease small subunit